MEYIHRSLERKFTRMSEFFKAVLVNGARQFGKTNMLKQLAEGQVRTYVTLDNLMARDMAKTDPVLFFQTYKAPHYYRRGTVRAGIVQSNQNHV
jgi:hypothetical protein